jgi:hypothetical protein
MALDLVVGAFIFYLAEVACPIAIPTTTSNPLPRHFSSGYIFLEQVSGVLIKFLAVGAFLTARAAPLPADEH